jgi:hypothetical protein
VVTIERETQIPTLSQFKDKLGVENKVKEQTVQVAKSQGSSMAVDYKMPLIEGYCLSLTFRHWVEADRILRLSSSLPQSSFLYQLTALEIIKVCNTNRRALLPPFSKPL